MDIVNDLKQIVKINIIKSLSRIERLILAKVDEYDKLALKLLDILLAEWDKATKSAIQDALRILSKPEVVTQKEIDEAIGLMGRILGDNFTDNVDEAIFQTVNDAYGAAQSDMFKLAPTFNMIDYDAIDWLYGNNIYWIGKHWDNTVSDRIKKAAERVLEKGLAREEAIQEFEKEFAEAFSKSKSYWSGLSNHVVTQAREFGHISAYEKAEITEYKVIAVKDHRTTPICQYMDGKIIAVSRAVKLRDDLMNATSPEQAKIISPFYNFKEGEVPPNAELLPGMEFPPYHFNCRSRTVAVS